MKKMLTIFTIILLVAMTIPAMAASAINKDGYYSGYYRGVFYSAGGVRYFCHK